MASIVVWKSSCQISLPVSLPAHSHRLSQLSVTVLANPLPPPLYSRKAIKYQALLLQFQCYVSLPPSFTHSPSFSNKHTRTVSQPFIKTVHTHSTLPSREYEREVDYSWSKRVSSRTGQSTFCALGFLCVCLNLLYLLFFWHSHHLL